MRTIGYGVAAVAGGIVVLATLNPLYSALVIGGLLMLVEWFD